MRLQLIGPTAILIAALATVGAESQTTVNWQGGATNNNWTTVSNWDSGALPTGSFDEIANIGNGATAVVNTDFATIAPPDGPPGDLIVTNNSKLDVIGAGKFLTDDSGPHVNGTAAFTNGGTLALTGGSTSFTSKGLSFANGGVYAPVISGASHGLISVAGDLNLGGGSLRPSFSFSPSVPQSWVLADATNIAGNFALDTTSAGLGFGRRLETSTVAGGVNGRQLKLDLKAVLGLTVNADTGAASISSPTGASITMTGYGLSSASPVLKSAGWSTLTSQLGGGWNVAGTPSTTQLNELGGPIPPGNTTQASLTLSSGSRTLGTPFNPSALPFGTPPAVQFQYVNSAGQVVAGDVQYTGLKAINNLLLTVDPATGQAQLMNSSQTTISIRGYSILSASGSLKPANGDWNSLHDQGRTGVDEANATSSHLSELIPLAANAVQLTPGQTFAMGDLFTTSGSRDLQLQFQYVTPAAIPGDFNSDGTVNQADLAVWQSQYGISLNGRDFLIWQRNFGLTSSSTTLTVATGVVKYGTVALAPFVTSVPEPTSAFLLIIGMTTALSLRRRC